MDKIDLFSLDRRNFLKLAPLGVMFPGAAWADDRPDHFVPAEKNLKPDWVRSLYERGERRWFSGKDLETIGMPVGGIGAGQVYLSGDGRLTYWEIFNRSVNTGYGQINYKVGRKPTQMVSKRRWLDPSAQAPDDIFGATLRVKSGDQEVTRRLDRATFPGVRFNGEYPIGTVEYPEDRFPVDIRLEAFSPYIPLNEPDSALPATILQYTVRNKTDRAQDVNVSVYLKNIVSLYSGKAYGDDLARKNEVRRGPGLSGVVSSAEIRNESNETDRPPQVFATFEGRDYGDWKKEGDAFGPGPARGTLEEQQQVSGFEGKGLVNTFFSGDETMGKLTSPEFTVERPYISFLAGGGDLQHKTCMNLVVDGEVVRTATGKREERLRPRNWDVRDLKGKNAHLEIVDSDDGPWGHVNIDQIEFRDAPMRDGAGEARKQSDFGTVCVAGLDAEGAQADAQPVERGGLATQRTALQPGASKTLTFVVTWHMPNRPGRGNYYAKRFANAWEVARYVHHHLDRLVGDTRLWRDTYYDSTLPYWLLDRLHSTMSNLATELTQWWRNGRFWAWEGCGCCRGTCGHVWNYAHGMARLFPRLERSVRERQDFAEGIGLDEDGAIAFRGENWGKWAGDSQGGYILKAYREHQCSADARFLERNWRNVKRALEFLIEEDGDEDGLLEGRQHQTYDQDYYGANTMVGSLYLAALRAGEEMATEMGDAVFASRCQAIFESGKKLSEERLFNGEYFIQTVDLKKHEKHQYADGCLADQLFGQGWAHQVGLGYVYDRNNVRSALKSIWKYCWAPDTGPQNDRHKPERWFSSPKEAGLFICTWPLSKHLGPSSTRYRNEVWTGIEYQVASHMVWEGMVEEALAICRAVDDRYLPSKRNPWNEIECGDHYARALASWGVITALSGFAYHGPRQRIAFAPAVTPEDFRCVYTTAEGWGTFTQKGGCVELANKWGRLLIREMQLDLASNRVDVTLDDQLLKVKTERHRGRLAVVFDEPVILKAGESLSIKAG